MADRRLTGINNQKRGVSVLVADLVEADILTTGSIYATLPPKTVVTGISVIVTTVSGTAGATLDVDYNGSEVGSEIAITTAGTIVDTVTTANAYSATGGNIVVTAGSTAPATGAFVGKLVVEYIELDKTTGEYTDSP